MQCSSQKRGQFGLSDAAAQYALGGAGVAQAAQQGLGELVNIIGATIGERVLYGMPCGLDWVELRSISGEPLEVQPRILAAEVSQTLRVMDRGAVPNDDDVSAQVAQQVPEEILNLRLRDVLRVQAEIQSEPASLRADRQSADHRDAIAAVVMMENRSLPHLGPGAPHRGNHHEAGFIGKDDVGAQPRGGFFTRGQSFRLHSPIRASFRSSARRSGFWQLKSRSCSRRAT